jgi:hypothetical protein
MFWLSGNMAILYKSPFTFEFPGLKYHVGDGFET